MSQNHYVMSLLIALMLLTSATTAVAQAQPAGGDQSVTPGNTQPQPNDGSAAIVIGDSLTVAELELRKAAVETNEEIVQDLRAQITQRYQAAIEQLNAAEAYSQRTAYYDSKRQSAPSDTDAARKEVERIKNLPPVDLPDVRSDIALDTIGQMLSDTQSRLASLQSERTRFEDETAQERGRLGQISTELAEAQRILDEIDTELKTFDPSVETTESAESLRVLLRSRKLARLTEIEKLQQEKLSHEPRMKWRDAELALFEAKINREQTAVDVYQEEVDRLSKIETQKRLADARKVLTKFENNEVLKPIAEENFNLAKELKELSERRAKRADQLSILKDELEDIKRTFDQARNKLDTLGMSEVFGRTLQSQRQALTDTVRRLSDTGELSNRLESLLLRQFDVNDRLSELRDIDTAAQRFVGSEASRQALQDARNLLTTNRQYLQTLEADLASSIGQINEVDSTRREFEGLADEFEDFLDERLIWTPNAKPVNRQFIEEIGEGVRWFVDDSNWRSVWPAFMQAVQSRTAESILLLTLFIGLLIAHRRMVTGLNVISGRIGLIYADRFRSTIEAIVFTAMLAMPGPLLIGGVGWMLTHATEPFAASLGMGLLSAGMIWYLLCFVRGLTRSHGLGSTHFRWRASGLSLLRNQLTWATPVLLIGTFAIQATRVSPEHVYLTGLGRLFFVVNMIVVAIVIFRLCHPASELIRPSLTRSPHGWLNRLRWVWFPVGFGMPLALAILALAGYLYSAMHLRERFIATVGLVLACAVIHATILRWQILTHSRLAIATAREKRKQMEEASREGMNDGESIDVSLDLPTVDLAAINENTRQLIRMIVGLGFIIGLWMIWADVIQAFTILDRVKIGNLSIDSINAEGETIEVPFTLANLATLVVLLIVSTLAVMNLPKMVEAAILQRTGMEPGTRYAWTAIFRYVLIAVGVIVVAQSVGLNWGSMQWLIAALGVGLGFGLQEIFANFVSGLILLFERPIRVGDTVTVGEISGTVTKIRMRATTIVDWDRKELIVPNREFITGQLINWSLSDLITRLIVRVGVAYGSETNQAHNLLLKVASENDEVLETPAPQAFLLGFGDNTLNFELRVFINNIDRRVHVMHELHMAIDKAFREADITIAFPQRDVHLDLLKPVEVKLVNPSEGVKKD